MTIGIFKILNYSDIPAQIVLNYLNTKDAEIILFYKQLFLKEIPKINVFDKEKKELKALQNRANLIWKRSGGSTVVLTNLLNSLISLGDAVLAVFGNFAAKIQAANLLPTQFVETPDNNLIEITVQLPWVKINDFKYTIANIYKPGQIIKQNLINDETQVYESITSNEDLVKLIGVDASTRRNIKINSKSIYAETVFAEKITIKNLTSQEKTIKELFFDDLRIAGYSRFSIAKALNLAPRNLIGVTSRGNGSKFAEKLVGSKGISITNSNNVTWKTITPNQNTPFVEVNQQAEFTPFIDLEKSLSEKYLRMNGIIKIEKSGTFNAQTSEINLMVGDANYLTIFKKELENKLSKIMEKALIFEFEQSLSLDPDFKSEMEKLSEVEFNFVLPENMLFNPEKKQENNSNFGQNNNFQNQKVGEKNETISDKRSIQSTN